MTCTLQASEEGLTSEEVKRRLDQYGYNKLPESTRIPFLVFLGYLWNPLSWAMEVAAILAIILLDYADFCLIIALLLVNATIRCNAANPNLRIETSMLLFQVIPRVQLNHNASQ